MMPCLIEDDEDEWIAKCPHCHNVIKSQRHGYSSRFFSSLYFVCPICEEEFEAPNIDRKCSRGKMKRYRVMMEALR